MIRGILAALAAVVIASAGCGGGAETEVEPVPTVVETVNLDEVPAAPLPVETPVPRLTPTAVAAPGPMPLAPLRVWPVADPAGWPRTPDEAAAAFARHVALGERSAEPRPAAQDGTAATAELPRLREDGSPFAVASTIHMQQVQLDDGTTAWVVIRALSQDIVVSSPAIGDLLAGGAVIEGEGRGFEGAIVFQVEDRDGVLGLALAQGGALGENLPFRTELPFRRRPASGDWAVLTGYTTSPVDGSLSALTALPMRLLDGS